MVRRKHLKVAGSLGGLLGLVTALAGGLIMSSATAAASNAGDFWLNNVGSTAPAQGHVPHLNYADIAVVARYPGGTGGTFTVTAWQPTGDNKTVVYTGQWLYNPKGADTQIVAVIPINQMFANMPAAFKAHPQQGFHFKMVCNTAQGKKMKVFWVAAPAAVVVTPTPAPTPSQTPSGGVLGEQIKLAETGGPLLGIGLLLMLLGGFTWLGSAALRRRS